MFSTSGVLTADQQEKLTKALHAAIQRAQAGTGVYPIGKVGTQTRIDWFKDRGFSYQAGEKVYRQILHKVGC